MPYTRAYVSGLRMGLTSDDLNSMPFGRLAWMLEEWAAMNGPKRSRPSVRKATQKDIELLL